MGIEFICSQCGATGMVDDRLAGRTLRCSECGGLIQIGAAGMPDAPVPEPMAPLNTRTCGLAVASMVLGILAVITLIFSVVLAPLALIFGFIALRHIKNAPELTGSGYAYAGLVTGCLALVLLQGMVLPAFARAREEGRKTVCRSNMEQIGRSIAAYQLNFRGYLPYQQPAPYWDAAGNVQYPAYATDSLALLYPEFTVGSSAVFSCPSTEDAAQCRVELRSGWRRTWFGNPLPANPTLPLHIQNLRAMNREVSQSSYGYDDKVHWNKAGSDHAILADMDQQATCNRYWPYTNHIGGGNVLYKDGRVHWVPTVYASNDENDNIFSIASLEENPDNSKKWPNWSADTDSYISRP